jgi:hypothetical protein
LVESLIGSGENGFGGIEVVSTSNYLEGFFFEIGIRTQGFMLPKQELYSLSQMSNPFWSGYFEDGGWVS